MHPNPTFRSVQIAHSLRFARARSFGTLALNGPQVPLFAHVPFLLNDTASAADLHLVRSNPIARQLADGPLYAKLSVTGPDSYISPDWYEQDDQVPTWNYIAVHFTGRLELLPQDDLRDLIDRQTAFFESQLAPKSPWTSDKMTDGVMDKMMRAIVPVRFSVDSIDSTWKLGQNKTEDARRAAAAQVGLNGIGSEISGLASWMDSPPEAD